MKTTWILLIAGLFLFSTPLLALAHNTDRHTRGQRHDNYGWFKDRHETRGHDRVERLERRIHKLKKRHQRQHRRQQWRSRHQAYGYNRPVYATAPLILTPPRIVFRIGW